MKVEFFQIDGSEQGELSEIPFFEVGVAAGSPVRVDSFHKSTINIQSELVKNREFTFCVKVSGQSMAGAGIDDGDLLIVDKKLRAEDDNIVLAVIDGEFTVKRLSVKGNRLFLQPENPDYEPIEITEFMSFRVWGVVTAVVKKLG